MELSEYLAIIGKRWMWLVGSILLGTIILGGYGFAAPISYDGTATLSFVKKPEQNVGTNYDYRYDDYYAIQTSEFLAETASGWLADPTVVLQIYGDAHIGVPFTSAKDYSRAFGLKRNGTTLVLSTTVGSAKDAESLVESATSFVNNRMQDLMKRELLDTTEVIIGKPLSVARVSSVPLYSSIGAIVGALIGLVLIFLAESLRPTKR